MPAKPNILIKSIPNSTMARLVVGEITSVGYGWNYPDHYLENIEIVMGFSDGDTSYINRETPAHTKVNLLKGIKWEPIYECMEFLEKSGIIKDGKIIPRKSFLKTFGFEIECEMEETTKNLFRRHGVVKGDGSISECGHGSGEPGFHDENIYLEAKEFASRVMKVADIERAKKLFESLQRKYEAKKFHWNRTMGFHIHLGFSPRNPPEIISLQFGRWFMKEIKKEFPTEYLQRRGNSYCKYSMSEQELAGFISYDRYRAVNIKGALSHHGTVEIRLFPSNEPAKMLKYLMFTISKVQEFLSSEIIETKKIYGITTKSILTASDILSLRAKETEKIKFSGEITKVGKEIIKIN